MGWWWVITKLAGALLCRSVRNTQNATFLWVDFSLAFFLVVWRTRNVRAALDLRNLLAGRRVLLGAPDLTWRSLTGAVCADARRRLCLKAASSSPFPPVLISSAGPSRAAGPFASRVLPVVCVPSPPDVSQEAV